MDNKIMVGDLARFVKKKDICDIPKPFVSMHLTLEEYVQMLTKDCNLLLLELFTRAWCTEHQEDPEHTDRIWSAFIYHFRRDCYPEYFFLHLKEYRRLGMVNNWWY